MHAYDPITMSNDPPKDDYEMATVEIVVEDEKEAIVATEPTVQTVPEPTITSVVVRPHAR
jgi:hypothetical protein